MILVIESGGCSDDASTDFLNVPSTFKVEVARDQYKEWLKTHTIISFVEWLIKFGHFSRAEPDKDYFLDSEVF